MTSVLFKAKAGVAGKMSIFGTKPRTTTCAYLNDHVVYKCLFCVYMCVYTEERIAVQISVNNITLCHVWSALDLTNKQTRGPLVICP